MPLKQISEHRETEERKELTSNDFAKFCQARDSHVADLVSATGEKFHRSPFLSSDRKISHPLAKLPAGSRSLFFNRKDTQMHR